MNHPRFGFLAAALIVAYASPSLAALPNGVASGDVTQNSAWLWARSDTTGLVTFEVATDAAFANVVNTFNAAVVDPMQPVKGMANGLAAGQQYYYRATDATLSSFNGSFRTAAAAGSHNGLRFGVSGDWRGELAPYPAIKNVASKNLDFFVKHGDTIYAERYSGPAQPTASTLADYRDRHNEVLSTRYGMNTWQDVRASTPVFAGIDDHEVVNDFAGGSPVGSGYYNDTQRYQDGLQAFREYMPIADTNYAGTGDARFDGKPNLYRAQQFGSDALMIMTDARSFRDAELAPWNGTQADAQRFLTESATQDRTMLGRTQLDQVKSDLSQAQQDGVTWKFLHIAEPTQNLGLAAAGDRYEGYERERTELLSYIKNEGIDNVVFVTADIHGTLVNNLTYSPDGVNQIESGAWEISTGAVAFEQPFGPTVVNLAASLGLLTPDQVAYYNSLPSDIAKDQFIKGLVNAQVLPLGYSGLGLEGSGIPFTNLMPTVPGYGQLDYSLATHSYGWTEFEIDAATGELIVTTWGIPDYSYDELTANPDLITGLAPQIVSRFSVTAVPEPETWAMLLAGLGLVGLVARRRL
ncbi:alkaline phosphatase D family protein [Thiobacillus sp.]|uniref:alkaline phosphatase D family protein n=1 Tax=Thiobacillus sp. TaxID=924 RepID=UPI0025D93E82|nr:alkaline phosphatase D family protein [Thiobacillus sp.]MBT9538294.1 alkaline phosphatase D family protein [Thiobacillus sp.]